VPQLVVNPDRRRLPKADKAPSLSKAACGKIGSVYLVTTVQEMANVAIATRG